MAFLIERNHDGSAFSTLTIAYQYFVSCQTSQLTLRSEASVGVLTTQNLRNVLYTKMTNDQKMVVGKTQSKSMS